MKYTIYHSPKVKIGCTINYPSRPIEQNLESFYIEDQVSEGCGIEFAGQVEKFWQWYYGLEESSRIPNYSQMTEMSNSPLNGFRTGAAGRIGGKAAGELGVTGFQTGAAGRSPLSGFRSGAAGRAATKIVYTCPHCNKAGRSNIMKRWHFNNCKWKI
jgi:hypothetical protein